MKAWHIMNLLYKVNCLFRCYTELTFFIGRINLNKNINLSTVKFTTILQPSSQPHSIHSLNKIAKLQPMFHLICLQITYHMQFDRLSYRLFMFSDMFLSFFFS